MSSKVKNLLRGYKLEFGMLLILIIMYIIFHFITGTALQPRNIMNVLQGAAPLLFLVMGQLLIVITGGIDLSVGSVYGFTGMVSAVIMIKYGIAAGVVAGLVAGCLCGLINGLLVSYANMAPFIVTLAMQGIASSITYLIVDGASQVIPFREFKLFNSGHIIPGVPNYILYMVILVILMYLMLRKTLFGRSIYAAGSNAEAARLVGISVKRVKTVCYTICGCLCATAALLNNAYLLTVECSAGSGMELNAISATVIGGASLSGGLGTAFGATVGTFITQGIRNGINLLGINSFWSGTVTGVVIILAVFIGASVANKKIKK
ncbi:MAG: ABC transporter permease [Lachnospiraceae bacterium]